MALPKEIARERGIEEIAGWMTKHKDASWCVSSKKEADRLKAQFPKLAKRIFISPPSL